MSMEAKPLLRVQALVVGYDYALLQPVSFELARGESLLIRGANGAGKSTLLRTLFGLQPPISGSAQWVGTGTGTRPRDLVRHGLRFLGQGNRGFGELSVPAQRGVLGRLYGLGKVDRSAPAGDGRKVGSLSYGQRRLAALRVLEAGEPLCYLLDEPLAGLDREASGEVLDWCRRVAERGTSFLVIEHRSGPLLDFFDRVMKIQGRSIELVGRASPQFRSTTLDNGGVDAASQQC